jgi:hypothetical protein
MAWETNKKTIKRIEKSAAEKRKKFIKDCNADPDLKAFDAKKRYALHALKLCRGNISNASKMISLSRRTIHQYMSDDPDFDEMVKLIKFEVLDQVEDKLLQNCDAGKETSIIYYLNCQGKDRGYGNALKVDGKINNINYNVPVTADEVKDIAKALEDEF